MRRVPTIRTTRRGKLSGSEAAQTNKELRELFEKAQHVNRKWEVRFVDGPMQGMSVESTEMQQVVSLWWPPPQLDPEGNEKKRLITYRRYDVNKRKAIQYFRVDRSAE